MEIAFHGAAGGVTGSCYLVTVGGARVLVDCGLFQGKDADREEPDLAFGFDPAGVDYVLLTHAHLDHCGRLPVLVQRGFRGEIVATGATRDLAGLVLLDAAHLQVEEARRSTRQRLRHGEPEQGPAFDVPDVLDAMERFGRAATYDAPFDLGDGIRVTFGDAGHILGSAWVLLDITDRGARTRALFSGDLGNPGTPILRPTEPAPAADCVVMESTYGDRLHKPLEPSVRELRKAIVETLDRGGNVVIPTFALERAQEILYILRELVERGELSRRLSVFLDSPLAISATRIFRRHRECMDDAARALFDAGDDPFSLPGLHYTRDTTESMAINTITGGAVILAGSGMATGGRVLHHLKHNLWREESSVVFVGYAAQGTLARRIIDGERTVRVLGEEVRVRARVYTIGGFSAHADRDDLLAWYQSSGSPSRTFLVHGEDGPRHALAAALRDRGHVVDLPELHSVYTL